MNHKPKPKKGNIPSFFIYMETNNLMIQNCMVDSWSMHNIMPLSILSIDSRSISTYGEIKYLRAKISSFPHIPTFFTIIFVDFPLVYYLVLG